MKDCKTMEWKTELEQVMDDIKPLKEAEVCSLLSLIITSEFKQHGTV